MCLKSGLTGFTALEGYFDVIGSILEVGNDVLLLVDFAASFDSKMGCLYSVFDAKKQGKPVWVVRARNWKLRGGEHRLSGLLEGVSVSGNVFTWLSSGLMKFGGLYWACWTFEFDSGIPRVTISGRFCDWTGSRGLHHMTFLCAYLRTHDLSVFG
ncbi:hypothetical protein GQ457_15G022970 [Hibiscus cannabinus]